jgi:formylglycine-generating enzyme
MSPYAPFKVNVAVSKRCTPSDSKLFPMPYNLIAQRWLFSLGRRALWGACWALTACGRPSATPAGMQSVPAANIASQTAVAENSPPPSESSPATLPSDAAAASLATPSPGVPAPPRPPAAPVRCPQGTALVPGGNFQRAGTSEPQALSDLCFDVLETTPPEYSECVTAGQCTATGLDCAAQSTYGKADKARHPMVCLRFEQAEAYCAFRGKRLPTTEEWEWAARGGAEGRTYPWGDAPPSEQLCWAGKRKQPESCEVGSHPEDRSVHGLLDLAGNVLEFTTTGADKTSKVRIARGGSWNVGAPELFRNARLGGFGLDYRCGFLGVRCVLPATAGPIGGADVPHQ